MMINGNKELVVLVQGVVIWIWGDKSAWRCAQSPMRDDVFQAYRTCLDTGTKIYSVDKKMLFLIE